MPIPGARTPVDQRLRARIKVTEAGCWEWMGKRKKDGYGVILMTLGVGHATRKEKLVHRIAYETWVGPLDPALTIDHLCRNRACINPDHLEQVTGAENTRRIPSQPFRIGATHCVNGHEFTPENTYVWKPRNSRTCRACNRAAAARRKARLMQEQQAT